MTALHVLNDISLLPSRARRCLVRPTGVDRRARNLLMRFYDPQEGRVLIDGFDVRHLRLASLRSHLPWCCRIRSSSGPIAENIRRTIDATDEDIECVEPCAPTSLWSALRIGTKPGEWPGTRLSVGSASSSRSHAP